MTPRFVRYESDGELISEVAKFVLEGLSAGQPALVIATGGHRHALAEAFARSGLDLDRESRSGKLTLLDADDMYRLFVAEGTPDWRLFENTLGTMIDRSASSAGQPVRVYSEMVDGDGQVAQPLAEMWHALADRHSFELLAPERVERPATERELCETIRTLRRAEHAERMRADELEETVRTNELFTSVLAHDLRNPLGAVLTAAQMLEMKGDQSDIGGRAIQRIHSSGQRMVRMIDQLLDFTQIRAGMPIDPKPTDLAEVVGGVIDELRHAYPKVEITFTHDGDAKGTYDADRLLQVFSNLIGNAAEHGTPNHGGVTVSLDATSDTLVVAIHNAGAIPAQLLPAVFAPMTSNKQRKRDGSRGLGLGLFITQQLVRAHGGTIGVASNDSDGTTFTVSLPRRAVGLATAPRRATSEAVRHDEQLLRMLVETVRDYAMFILDRDGHVKTWNRGAELIKGYAPAEIIGKHISTFYAPEDRERDLPQSLLRRAVIEGRVEDEGWRVRKDGSRFWADVVITALRDQTGELYGFAKVTRDLSERRQAEDTRLELAKAHESIRLRDEFLSIVSHELRTPLAGLQLQLDSLSEARTEHPKLATKLDRAIASTHRLTQLVESLLDVSRIATGRFLLQLEPVDLAPIVEEVVDSFRPAAARASCDLTTHLEPIVGTFDRVRIAQIITNLLSNAIRYGAGRPVEIELRRERTFAVLAIRDHGPGVKAADLERIFQRFERAVATRHYGGLGIGLYVVRESVLAHRGSVAITTPEGGGASFVVRLPLTPA